MSGSINTIDIVTLVVYFVAVLGIGFFKGRGKRGDTKSFFVARGTFPWWVIAAAFVATGMNTEQLVGQNGMAYTVGLPLLNWYFIAFVVYSLLMFVFLPVYLRSGIMTMPEYLGRRFDRKCQDIFTVILILSYVFMNLAVIFYGGAKLLEIIFGLNIWVGVLLIGIVAGLYTMYGGMSSAAYAAVFQFVLIFGSGFFLMYLAWKAVDGTWLEAWNTMKAHSPCGFHLMKGPDYPQIPWQAVPLTILGIHLYYSCVNQSLVQGCFGAKTEWDARIGLIAAGFFVVLRPFVEFFPGLFCRAIELTRPEFMADAYVNGTFSPDNVLPILIRELVPAGFQGLILIGVLASVMSTISALLNSISTLFTMNVYKRWFNPAADEKRLVKVGTFATCGLMLFAIGFSPCIGILSGGIFQYFQTLASYVTVPLATVFLIGVLWKRATSPAAFTVLLGGIPLGILVAKVLVPFCFSPEHITVYNQTLAHWNFTIPTDLIHRWSLDNPFITGAMTQVLCVILMFVISWMSQPKPVEEVRVLTFSLDKLRLPLTEPRHSFFASVPFWWTLFILFYVAIYIFLW